MADTLQATEKPAVLIIGGLGYIGRFLALHIERNNLASDVRIVDKVIPQLAWLAPEFSQACSVDKFLQADASREASLAKVFNRPDGKEWDYVFNCGGETRYSQEDEVYRLRSLALSVALGQEAAKRGVKVFIELSTGMVYKPDSSPSQEGSKLKPWSKIAVFKLEAEEKLSAIEGLNLVIVRLAHVYGPYASQWLATALCMARVYKHLDTEMKWLWTRELRTNTIHIDDATSAMWAAADWFVGGKANWDARSMGDRPIFNLVDRGATTQGIVADIIRDVFEIKTSFQGQIVSTFARLNLDSILDDVNEEVLGPWAELLTTAAISRPGPLSPFMERELVKDTDLSMDGGRFESVGGFTYKHPQITRALVEDMIESYRRMNWWP